MLSKILGVHCVAESDMLVVFFEDENHQIGFFNLWGNSMKQGNKRVHSTLTGFPSGSVRLESFTMGDKVLHALYDNDNNIRYFATLAKEPVIRLDIHDVPSGSNIKGSISVFMKNSQDSGAKIFNNVTLRSMDTSIKVTNKNINKGPNNTNYSLDDYMVLDGHVYNATLRDERSDRSSKVQILQRAHMYTSFTPSAFDQVIY